MKQPDFSLSQGWWYPAILSVILLLIVFFMPKKRINSKEIYITFGVIGYIVWMIDMTIAVPFDLFDLGTHEKKGYLNLPYLVLYPHVYLLFI